MLLMLRAWGFVESLVMPPLPMVTSEPPRVKALAPELNARPAKLHELSILGLGRVLPANWTVTAPLLAGLWAATQLASVDQLLSPALPPFQTTTWARAMDGRKGVRPRALRRPTRECVRCISGIVRNGRESDS